MDVILLKHHPHCVHRLSGLGMPSGWDWLDADGWHEERKMVDFQVGDWVVYRKTKFSASPGPRAVNVVPSAAGEEYSYQVDKYWVVVEVTDGKLVLGTRRGKRHRVRLGDPCLRRASFWERRHHRRRFVDAA
ncbi:MAG: hypothetical protein KDB14_05315 [Planctomycetales bacterium]|nr:hypothetical protein [Planctomycetales bacterium]